MLDVRLRLREAIIEGNVLVVKRILRRFPHHLKNINPENGWSSLHYAGYYGRYIICVSLVSLGHDRDEISLNFDNNAPVHTTVLSGNHQTLLMILQAFPESLNLKGDCLRSPLHMAVVLDFNTCVDLLIEKGANINAIDVDGNTPLHLAMMYASKNSIKSLMIHNAYIDIRNAQGWLPVECARDIETEQWFNQLKQEVIAGKYKVTQNVKVPSSTANSNINNSNLTSSYSSNEGDSAFSNKTSNLFSSYHTIGTTNTTNSAAASMISQPAHGKLSRDNTLDSIEFQNEHKYNELPRETRQRSATSSQAMENKTTRKHSNSSPVFFRSSSLSYNHNKNSPNVADASIQEEPMTPTGTEFHNSKSSSELSSMLSPVFPPSIPPAPNNTLSSSGNPFSYPQNRSGNDSPLSPSLQPINSSLFHNSPVLNERKKATASQPLGQALSAAQAIKFSKQIRSRSNSNEVYNTRKIPQFNRIHSNSVGTTSHQYHQYVNSGSNTNLPDAAFKSLFSKNSGSDVGSLASQGSSAKSPHVSPQKSLRGVKSSSSLVNKLPSKFDGNIANNASMLSNSHSSSGSNIAYSRPRASSVQNMINIPEDVPKFTSLSMSRSNSSDKELVDPVSKSRSGTSVDLSHSVLGNDVYPQNPFTYNLDGGSTNSDMRNISSSTQMMQLSDQECNDDSGTDVDSSDDESSPTMNPLPTFDVRYESPDQ